MTKLVQVLASIIILATLGLGSFIFYTNNNSSDPVFQQSYLYEKMDFYNGYQYIENTQYQKALTFYQTNDYDNESLESKKEQLILVLRRLVNAEKEYTQKKSLLEEVEQAKDEVFNPTFEKMEELYLIYELSEQTLKDDIYNIETTQASNLLDKWSNNKEEYITFIDELSETSFPYMTDDQQDSLYKSALYSITPVNITYRLTHTNDDINESDLRLIEQSWNYWEQEYKAVMAFITSFQDSYYLLTEEVEDLKLGYKGIESQLYSLIPNLSKTDL
ncbi:hypothetical protein PRVXT_001217 [Proteinivorax tanatarense]|uniref:Uncharacterized protein n=1 Tax=Proteinivorax tanatarense TaxID=1260629 RepID=A0AAU7VQ18_9FIRM